MLGRARIGGEPPGSRARLATNEFPGPRRARVQRPTGETMPVLKSILAGVAELCLVGAATAQAEPVKIRLVYVVPVANWAPMLAAGSDNPSFAGKPSVLCFASRLANPKRERKGP
jgi:hypothetical protein